MICCYTQTDVSRRIDSRLKALSGNVPGLFVCVRIQLTEAGVGNYVLDDLYSAAPAASSRNHWARMTTSSVHILVQGTFSFFFFDRSRVVIFFLLILLF